jgi:hypothetical protein
MTNSWKGNIHISGEQIHPVNEEALPWSKQSVTEL